MGAQLRAAGFVGVPNAGEKVCPSCKGRGLLNRPNKSYPGYEGCERCDGTGVVAIRMPKP